MNDSAPDPTPALTPAEEAERAKSPRRAMCAAVLTLEAVVLALTAPVMITLGDVDPGVALSVALGLAVACLLVAGMLRRESAYVAGHAIQVAAVGLGFVIPVMWAIGAIFALLWAMAFGLGRKIEQERAAAFADYDRRRES